MARSKKYQEFLLEHLTDHDEAVAYLNAALEESLKGDEESQQLFLIALRNVAEAQGGVGALAKKAHVGRESLFFSSHNMDTGVQMKHNEATHEKMYELLMHAASQLRKKLAIDDLSYRAQLSPSTDSKKYFLHNVLNEFDKAVFSLMFACGFLADNRNAAQPQEIDKPMTSKIFQTKIDELALWRRKLVEVLADLIGFKKANVASYYHHYNLLHELNKKKKDAKDRRTFWGCTNKTAAREIKAIEDNAQQISINLDPQKCWYAEKNKAGQIQNKLSNESSRFESILSIASKHHKALLLSYRNAFGKPSELLYPERITEAKDTTIQDFEQAIRGLILLGLHVLSAIKDLLRIHNVKGSLKQV